MHQPVDASEEQRAEATRRRQHAEWFYRGWTDYLEGRPIRPPGGWSQKARDLYYEGGEAAQLAVEQMKEQR